MPYRGLDHSGPACYRHAAAQASETCAHCLQAICDICVGYEDTRPHCPPCAQKVRRRRRAARAATVAVGLMVVVGTVLGMGYLVTREKPYDYGVDVAEVRALEERVAAEPCARPPTLQLTETMLRAGNYRGTLKKVKWFNTECGEWTRLLWVSYSAHFHLSELDAAIADATRLIKKSPSDKDFYWWRAEAEEEKGVLDAAIADYQKALEVEPALRGIPFNLSNLLERQQRYCEAMTPLNDFLHYHPDVEDRGSVEARLDRLSALCAGPKDVKK